MILLEHRIITFKDTLVKEKRVSQTQPHALRQHETGRKKCHSAFLLTPSWLWAALGHCSPYCPAAPFLASKRNLISRLVTSGYMLATLGKVTLPTGRSTWELL